MIVFQNFAAIIEVGTRESHMKYQGWRQKSFVPVCIQASTEQPNGIVVFIAKIVKLQKSLPVVAVCN